MRNTLYTTQYVSHCVSSLPPSLSMALNDEYLLRRGRGREKM
jgi:hypothetical protein